MLSLKMEVDDIISDLVDDYIGWEALHGLAPGAHSVFLSSDALGEVILSKRVRGNRV